MRRNIVHWALVLGGLLIALGLSPARAQNADQGPFTALAWSTGGVDSAGSAWLALGSSRGVWLVTSGAEGLGAPVYLEDSPRETGGISALAFSPDGASVAGARFDGVIRVWDTATRAQRATLRGHIGAVNGLAWSPDGRFIASAGDDLMVRTWDASTGALLAVLDRHAARVEATAFNGDSSRLVSAGADSQVLTWRTDDWAALSSPQGHRGAVHDVRFAPDGTRFLTGSSDGTGRLWRAAGGETLAMLAGGAARVIAVGWQGDTPLTFAWDGAIRHWDSAGGLLKSVEGLPVRVRAASFSPDDARLALIVDDQHVAVYNTQTGDLVGTVAAPE